MADREPQAIPEDVRQDFVMAYRSALIDEATWQRMEPGGIAYNQAVARVSQWAFVFDRLGWPREEPVYSWMTRDWPSAVSGG